MIDKTLKSDLLLDQMQSFALADKQVELDEEQLKFLIFRLENNLFALKGEEAKEILSCAALTWIPGANAVLPGVVNVRGEVMAVLDLKAILELQAADENAHKKQGGKPETGLLILVRAGDGRNCLLVDQVVDVTDIPISANVPLVASAAQSYRLFAVSQFEYEQAVVIVLDAATIVTKANA